MGWDGEVELEREEGGRSDLNDTTPSHHPRIEERMISRNSANKKQRPFWSLRILVE
jgi:hypothetical protein